MVSHPLRLRSQYMPLASASRDCGAVVGVLVDLKLCVKQGLAKCGVYFG